MSKEDPKEGEEGYEVFKSFILMILLSILTTLMIKLVFFDDPTILNEEWLVYATLVVTIIFLFGIIKDMLPSGSLTKSIITSSKFWIFTHFLYYFALAKFLKSKWHFIVLKQLMWEVLEAMLNDFSVSYFAETKKKKWWDIIANFSGYYIGNMVFGSSALRAEDRARS